MYQYVKAKQAWFLIWLISKTIMQKFIVLRSK